MQLSERRAWNKTTTTKTNNNKSWKRLQVLIAARSLNKTFLLYVLQSCYTTAKTCVTTYNKCLCLHNILYWIQYSKSKIAENKQAILQINCGMFFHKKLKIHNTDAQKFNILISIKLIISKWNITQWGIHCRLHKNCSLPPKISHTIFIDIFFKYALQFVCIMEVYVIWIWMLSVTF